MYIKFKLPNGQILNHAGAAGDHSNGCCCEMSGSWADPCAVLYVTSSTLNELESGKVPNGTK